MLHSWDRVLQFKSLTLFSSMHGAHYSQQLHFLFHMTKGQSSEILETHLQYSALVFYSIRRGFFLAKQPFSSWWYGTILIMDISYLVPDASNSFNFNLVAVLGFSAIFWTKVYSSFELFCVFLKKWRLCILKIFTFACNCLNNGTFHYASKEESDF